MTRSTPAAGRSRRGFALLAILWVLVGLALLGAGDARVARSALAVERNRTNETVARWQAIGCAEVVHEVIDAALADSAADAAASWDTLDVALRSMPARFGGIECAIAAEASGDRLNVNTADADELRATLINADVGPERADSITDALLDWRDGDTIPRALGAEARWYRAHQRPEPSNQPFADVRELAYVRGLEHDDSVRSLLGVDPGRIVIDRAPLALIAALPGMSAEAVGRIADMRLRHERVNDLTVLGASLSEDARRQLATSYARLTTRITSEPDFWTVRVTSVAGAPPVAATEEIRFVRAARRAGVVRVREWP